MNRKFITAILSFGFILFGGLLTQTANAATRTVDTTTDNPALTACTAAANDCSLRGAISGAASGDTVNFAASLNGATITLAGFIPLTRSLNITGPGADKLTISGGGTTRIFDYFGGVTLNFNFSGMTLASGNGIGGSNGNQGGAMEINGGATNATFDGMVFRNNSTSLLAGAILFASGIGSVCRIKNSAFINNSSADASVIYDPLGFGTIEITNSTFSGNSANRFGIVYSSSGRVVVRNSTIVGNNGGGLYKTGSATMTLANTIVTGNGGYDLNQASGTIATNGGNLIGRNTSAGGNFAAGAPNAGNDYVGTAATPINPQLAPLGIYGGTTPTFALLANSPALNHGNNCVTNNSCAPAVDAALTTDQRGAARQTGGTVDIGAFESNAAFVAQLPAGTVSQNYNLTLVPNTGSFTYSLTGGTPPSGLNLSSAFAPSAVFSLSGTPTLGGSYNFQVTATDGVNSLITNYAITINAAPTAAAVAVSGRVLTPDGRGLMNATVVLTNASGITRTTRTSSFGYYRFENVDAGEAYVFDVRSKLYQFVPQIVIVNEDLSDLNLIVE